MRTVAAGESLLAPAVTSRMVERFVRTPPADGAAQRERFAELAVAAERRAGSVYAPSGRSRKGHTATLFPATCQRAR